MRCTLKSCDQRICRFIAPPRVRCPACSAKHAHRQQLSTCRAKAGTHPYRTCELSLIHRRQSIPSTVHIDSSDRRLATIVSGKDAMASFFFIPTSGPTGATGLHRLLVGSHPVVVRGRKERTPCRCYAACMALNH